MAYTTPATWVSGATLTAAQMNTQVRDNLSAIRDTGRVFASTSNQSISNNTWTAHLWGGEAYDTSSGMHSTGVNTDRFIATDNGVHSIVAVVGFAANATGVRGIKIDKNGGTGTGGHVMQVSAGAGQDWVGTVAWEEYLTAGDYFRVMVFQTSGGALSTVASTPSFCVFRHTGNG